MDYGSLLQLAKKNADQKNGAKPRVLSALPPVRTAEDARKQELEKKKLLDANVAKFLAKRKEEEARKRKEANEKRGELLALRNKDSKARRRVKVMNSSAKSADKCAIQDAVGPSDYYVIEEPLCFMSQESLAQEEKFLNKLCNGPAEEKFSKGKINNNKDLMGTKNRVKLALQLGDTFGKEKFKVEKERTSVSTKSSHRREEKRPTSAADSNSDDDAQTKVKSAPKKIRKPQPPPMNYQDLLLLAEKLHKEPVKEVQEKEPAGLRPMTAKEREIYLQEEASRKRKEAGWREEERLKKLGKLPTYKMPVPSQPRIPKIGAATTREEKASTSIPRIPKLNGYSQDKKLTSRDEPNSKTSNPRPSERPNVPKSSTDREKSSTKTSHHSTASSSGSESSKTKPPLSNSKQTSLSKPPQTKPAETSKLPSRPQPIQKPTNNERKPAQPAIKKTSAASTKPRQFPPSDVRSNAPSQSRPIPADLKSRPTSSQVPPRQPAAASSKSKPSSAQDARPRPLPSADTKPKQPAAKIQPRQFPPPDVKSRQFPPADVRSRPAGSADSRPKQFPPADMRRKPKPVQKRRIIESDDEYDSDVADFIDDGPEGNDEDYSKHIREIFGYDPSRYKGIDEDDRGMESSFQQQLKEEFTSTKLGILEDLEDIKKEKMAMLRKKKRQKVK